MDRNKELVGLVQQQIAIERDSVARLTETEKKVGSSVARLLLVEMRMDSHKHATVLEAVLDALTEDPSSKSSEHRALIGFVDPIIVRREIENHKALGKSMLAHLQKEMTRTKDEGILTLLGHLAQDEKRHSEILTTLARKWDRIIR